MVITQADTNISFEDKSNFNLMILLNVLGYLFNNII